MVVEELAVEEPPDQGYIPKRNRSIKRSSRMVDSLDTPENEQPPPSAKSPEPEPPRKRHSRRQLVEESDENKE